MTEQEIKQQLLVAFDDANDEQASKAAVAGLVAHALFNLQRIADALEPQVVLAEASKA